MIEEFQFTIPYSFSKYISAILQRNTIFFDDRVYVIYYFINIIFYLLFIKFKITIFIVFL